MDLARGRSRAPAVRVRPRPSVRRRPAPRDRHRRSARRADPRPRRGQRHLRGNRPGRRPDPHHPHAGRIRGDPASPRLVRSRARCCGGGRPARRSGRHGRLRVSRRPDRLRRAGLRRSARVPAGATGSPDRRACPGACTGPGAGPCAGADRHAGARAGTRPDARGDSGSYADYLPCPDRRRDTAGLSARDGPRTNGGAPGREPCSRSSTTGGGSAAGAHGPCPCADGFSPGAAGGRASGRSRAGRGCRARPAGHSRTRGLTGPGSAATSGRTSSEHRSVALRARPAALTASRPIGRSGAVTDAAARSAGARASGLDPARAVGEHRLTHTGAGGRRRRRADRTAPDGFVALGLTRGDTARVGSSHRPSAVARARARRPATGRLTVPGVAACAGS